MNDQLNWELYSAYIYFAMAAHFESVNLPGCANWMKVQAQEEMTHVMKFYDFVNERGGRVTLAAVEAPPTEWDSPLAAFEHAYGHEQGVSERINKLVGPGGRRERPRHQRLPPVVRYRTGGGGSVGRRDSTEAQARGERKRRALYARPGVGAARLRAAGGRGRYSRRLAAPFTRKGFIGLRG